MDIRACLEHLRQGHRVPSPRRQMQSAGTGIGLLAVHISTMANQCCHCLMVTSCASITEDRVYVELLVTLAVVAGDLLDRRLIRH